MEHRIIFTFGVNRVTEKVDADNVRLGIAAARKLLTPFERRVYRVASVATRCRFVDGYLNECKKWRSEPGHCPSHAT